MVYYSQSNLTILRERTVSRDEHRQILSRLDVLERVVSDLVVEVRELRREMDERFDRMNERFDRMYERMLVMPRWTVGTLALFGTAIAILLAISQFVK
jgi:type VI protein secretion system component VasF